MPEPFEFDSEDSVPPGRTELGAPGPGASPTNRVIAKVRTPNYVPPGFVVRARIDDTMFTADASDDAVAKADADPNVESIALARGLDLTD